MLFTSKTILISRLKIFPFWFAVGITWRSEILYAQKFSASPLQDFSMPSSVTGQVGDSVSCYFSTGTASGSLHKGYMWLLHQLPLFSQSQGSSCVLLLLQSPFCTWSEKPHWDGRRPAVVQFMSKNGYKNQILLKSVCIAPKGHAELFRRCLCHCGGGGGREGQFSPQIPLLRGLFVPWGFSAQTTEVEGIKSTFVVSHLWIWGKISSNPPPWATS